MKTARFDELSTGDVFELRESPHKVVKLTRRLAIWAHGRTMPFQVCAETVVDVVKRHETQN